jgi:hypothetical protein
MRAARPLLALAVLLAAVGGVAAATDDGPGRDPSHVAADAHGSTTSTSISRTTTTVAPTTSSVLDGSATTVPTPSTSVAAGKPTPSTRPGIPTTTAPAPATTMATVPSGGIPAGAARVLLVNQTDVPLDIAVNQAALRLGPGQSEEGFVLAELGATNSAPGQDLIVAAIPTNYGLRDEGCGDSRLGQYISPGKSYRIRFYNSGTCQLLGGGPKPTIAITLR